jgi:hypothetical protein
LTAAHTPQLSPAAAHTLELCPAAIAPTAITELRLVRAPELRPTAVTELCPKLGPAAPLVHAHVARLH